MRVTMIAGSNRANATSTQLLRYIESLLREKQISVSFLELSQLVLPLFSPDHSDFHPNAKYLVEAVESGDGLILATSEYHGSISGTLKNALDHVRPDQMAGKPVLSISSAGGPVGVSSLTHLQTIIRCLHGINCSEWISIGYGTNQFDESGVPQDEGVKDRVQIGIQHFLELTQKLTKNTSVSH
ncbi:NAD(P)H-dependent FMN reductase [Seinonella peptonophila]|uniref:NAD(P)H-dependent FMN reductase n=1 Tax=Seinonella peptonophila TaxID=112248 RepID=A0A1M4X2G6_9BACL|nr:NADPH-dependent FMN reductase [Seinonella peptonophila]SHE87523.1 NAD(P)H-dependent FMN reductase [Seinonella peptonophila]